MSAMPGRSVRLFLVDGKPTGIITAEIMNWTGHVLTGPRSQLPRILARGEAARTGLYLLYGADPDEPDMLRLYVGESDAVASRLRQHNQDERKGYWERLCIITSKDQNITKAHACYLEARLIRIALSAGRAQVDNATVPPLPTLPEADRSDIETFIEQIHLVLPVLGIDLLREGPKPSSAISCRSASQEAAAGPLFELTQRKSGLRAWAREVDGDFVVLQGSHFVREWRQPTTGRLSYSKLHERLLASGKLAPVPDGVLAVLQEDTNFSSPSAASSVVLGRADNGRMSWKVEGTDTSYADWQEQQVEASARLEGVDEKKPLA